MSGLFTKIIQGEIPSYKIHEDDLTYSFLALDQINLGHTLVIPKEEVDHFMDVPPETAARVFHNAQKIGKAIKKITGCKRVGIMVQGFEVPHYHMHLIPAWGPADMSFAKATRRTEEEMLKIQKEIRSQL